jgi:hypothetical protein
MSTLVMVGVDWRNLDIRQLRSRFDEMSKVSGLFASRCPLLSCDFKLVLEHRCPDNRTSLVVVAVRIARKRHVRSIVTPTEQQMKASIVGSVPVRHIYRLIELTRRSGPSFLSYMHRLLNGFISVIDIQLADDRLGGEKALSLTRV